MAQQHAVDDGQAQAGTVGLPARRVEAGERFHQLLDLFRRHACAVVLHLDNHLFRAVAGAQMAGDIDFRHVAARRLAIAARILDQVVQHAAQVGGVAHRMRAFGDAGVDLHVRQAHRFARHVEQQAAQVHVRKARRFRRLGIVEELADDGVHLPDIGLDAFARLVRQVGHFHFQLHARQRRAQVVRNAGQNHGAVRFHLFQVIDHLVEAAVRLDDFDRAFFRQRRRLLALGDVARGRRQARQRQIDQAGNDGRAQQGQQGHQAGPAQPLEARQAAQALAVQHQPVFVVVDLEADPEAGHAVDARGKARVLAQLGFYLRLDLGHQVIIGRRLDAVVLFQREDADAFVADEVEQQLAPQLGRRVRQCRMRDGNDGNDLGGNLLRLRLALDDGNHADPGDHADRGQGAEQQKGAPEQAAFQPRQADIGNKLHHASPAISAAVRPG